MFPTDIFTDSSGTIFITRSTHIFECIEHIEIKIYHTKRLVKRSWLTWKMFRLKNNQLTFLRKMLFIRLQEMHFLFCICRVQLYFHELKSIINQTFWSTDLCENIWKNLFYNHLCIICGRSETRMNSIVRNLEKFRERLILSSHMDIFYTVFLYWSFFGDHCNICLSWYVLTSWK